MSPYDYSNPNFPINQAVHADLHFSLGRTKGRSSLFCLIALSVPSNIARYCPIVTSDLTGINFLIHGASQRNHSHDQSHPTGMAQH